MSTDVAEANLSQGRSLTPTSASVYLKAVHGVSTSPATLSKYRCLGGGPVFMKFGRRILYVPSDLDRWVKDRLSRPLANTSRPTSFQREGTGNDF